jgi:endonuclease/exonuclease/phosphatase family metal-dependent hydrolase
MKRGLLVLCAFSLFATGACSDRPEVLAPDGPQFGVGLGEPVTVMSRNLYLGANIDVLLDPSIPFEVGLGIALGQLERTFFPARAQQLAMEIASRQPHVVGLQEVTRYDFQTLAGPQTIDFLAILQSWLAALGANYDVAVFQQNATLLLPGAGPILAIGYADGDAILVRSDLPWKDADSDYFENQVSLNVLGFEFENLRGWNAVSAQVGGNWYRFVNTHLEIQPFRPVQEAQARELVALLEGETLPIIMVGDFNSAANRDAPPESKTGSYDIFRRAGFADLWLREPHSLGGLTCCQLPDLSNEESVLDQRLDIVFARAGRNGFGGRSSVEVFGDDPADRFMVAPDWFLWPSDHAGVFAEIWFAPGLLARGRP